MEFNCTKRTLENMETQNMVSLQDVLGIFQDIVTDIEQPLDELPGGESAEFISLLAWIATEIFYLLKKNEKNIDGHKLGEKIIKRQAEIAKISKDLKEAEEQIIIFQEAEQTLLKIQREQEQKNVLKKQLEDRCNELEKENKRLELVKIEELEFNKKTLQEKKVFLEASAQKLEQECKNLEEVKQKLNSEYSMLQESVKSDRVQISALKSQLDDLEMIKEKGQKMLQSLKKEITDMNTNLECQNNQIEDLKQERKEISYELDINTKQVEDLKQKRDLLKNECNEVKKQKTQLEQNVEQLGVEKMQLQNGVSEITSEKIALEKDNLEKQADFDILKARVETLGTEKRELIKKINELDENIQTLNIDVLKKRYEEKATKCAQLKKEQDEILADEKYIATEIVNLESNIKEKKETITHKKAIVTALEHQKQSVGKDLEAMKLQKEKLEQWFKDMEYQKYAEETQMLKKRLEVLNSAKTELSRELGKDLFMTDEAAKVQVREFRENLEISLKNIHDELNKVQKKYSKISKIICE